MMSIEPNRWGIHTGKTDEDCAATLKLYEWSGFEKSALMVRREQLRQAVIPSVLFLSDRVRS